MRRQMLTSNPPKINTFSQLETPNLIYYGLYPTYCRLSQTIWYTFHYFLASTHKTSKKNPSKTLFPMSYEGHTSRLEIKPHLHFSMSSKHRSTNTTCWFWAAPFDFSKWNSSDISFTEAINRWAKERAFDFVMLNPSEIFALNWVVVLTPALWHVSTSREAHLNWQSNSALRVPAAAALVVGAMVQTGG